jgi:4-hydroxy-2-oxoheptanedioate aldolase
VYESTSLATPDSFSGGRALRAAMGRAGPLVACFLSSASAAHAEVIATAGFDAVIVDCQHGQVADGDLVALIRILDRDAVPAIVRVARGTPELIGRALDAGAAGVIVPMVSSVDEARAAVAATRYPPQGERSFGPLRAGLRRDYSVDDENRDVVLAVMIETGAGLDAVDEIAALDGVDALFTGPADLGLSLGHPATLAPDAGSPHEAAIVAVAAAARGAGRAAWIAGTSVASLNRWRAHGYDLVTVGSDIGMLVAASRAAAAEARQIATSA